jgi:hypothetical protein
MRQHGNVPTERHQDLAHVGVIGLKKSAIAAAKCEWEGADLTGRIAVEIPSGGKWNRMHVRNQNPDSNAVVVRA